MLYIHLVYKFRNLIHCYVLQWSKMAYSSRSALLPSDFGFTSGSGDTIKSKLKTVGKAPRAKLPRKPRSPGQKPYLPKKVVRNLPWKRVN
jgi:hypothetical protein